MNVSARVKMLLNLSLDENGFANVERIRAVCDYILQEVDSSEQISTLKEYAKRLEPILSKQTAVIETSGELSKTTLDMLMEKIKRRMGKSVEVQTKLNKNLLGGIRITCGDDIFERSTSDKINTLAQSCKIR
ncbi:MAG: F0F1 ATP synthase subunit delta [Opitutales bacterium]|nr:F0F1 ATP synthase subunit delta [Opitutales bacterium]